MADMKYFEENGKLYKIDSDGEKYRISFSEELQLKNLKASQENKKWAVYNFYVKLGLLAVMLMLFLMLMFVLYELDRVDFFTGILYR